MTGVNWINLAGSVAGADIGYYFPTSSTVRGLREARTGSWSQVNTGGSTSQVTRNYLNLWFDHGANPSNKTYSYVVLPNKTSAQTSSYASSPNVSILANTAQIQAVKETTLGLIGANFWEDTNQTIDIITSDKKASVMVKQDATEIEVAISDPTQANTGTINIVLNKDAGALISADSNVTVTQLSPTIILSVNVANSNGKTFKAKFALKNFITADAYVRDGSYASINYPSETTLAVKDATAGSDRQAYLKADLTSVNGPITSAKLVIYAGIADTGGTQALSKVYGVSSNSWTESGITWNSKPAVNSSYAYSFVATDVYGWKEIDITSFVNAQLAGSKIVSLAILQELADIGLFTGVKSKEHATYKPYIYIIK